MAIYWQSPEISFSSVVTTLVLVTLTAFMAFAILTRQQQRYLNRHDISLSLIISSYIAEVILSIDNGVLFAQYQHWVLQVIIFSLAWVVSWALQSASRYTSWSLAIASFVLDWLRLSFSPIPRWEMEGIKALHLCTAIRIICLIHISGYNMANNAGWCGTAVSETGTANSPIGKSILSASTKSLHLESVSTCLIDDASDSEDEDADIKRRRAERLKEAGGWLGYIKDFAIFLPFLTPKTDRKVQVCIFVSLLCLVGNRILYILIPRQLGLATDQLLEKKSPIKALSLWLLLSVIGEKGFLGLAELLAKTPIKQFAYRQLTNLAFSHVMSLPMEFHSEQDSAEVTKAIEQGESLTNVLETLIIDIAPTFIDLVIAAIILYYKFNCYIALTMGTSATIYVLLEVACSSWSVSIRRESKRAQREESRLMHQAVQGWQTVTYFNMFSFERSRFSRAVNTQLSANARLGFYMACVQTIADLMIPLTLFALGCLVFFEASQGRSSAGDFVFLIQYLDRLVQPLEMLSLNYRFLMSDLVDAERLLHLLETKSTIQEKEDANELENVKGFIEFSKVHFSYDLKKPTIHDLSISIKPGQTVALVGETGAGKSSIIKLLLRFYDVQQGSIMIDGHDIRSITLGSLRNSLGVVPQDPLMFNTSIAENLRYARPSATDDEIFEACRAAAIHDKILTFSDGYQSQVGENGLKLSGGEIQRLAIARIFLKDPPILILDEATSAIDSKTEADIQDALDRLRRTRTTIIIAHRLSTIIHADKILVLHDGRVVEDGVHSELLSGKGRYRELWMKQSGSA